MSYKPCLVKPITMPLLNQSALCGKWYGLAFYENSFDSACEELVMTFLLQNNGDLCLKQTNKIKGHEVVKVGKLLLCKEFYNEPSKLTAEMQIDAKTCICKRSFNVERHTVEGMGMKGIAVIISKDNIKLSGTRSSTTVEKVTFSDKGITKSHSEPHLSHHTDLVVSSVEPQHADVIVVKSSSEPIISQRNPKDMCGNTIPKCMFCSIKDEFSFWIHWTDYKNFLVVGNPNGEFLYVMGRNKCVTKYEIDNLIVFCQRLGYKPNLINRLYA